MMKAEPNHNQNGIGAKFWFLLAWVMLFLMALLTNLDGSFFTIFLALACIFFFVGFWNSPRAPFRSSDDVRAQARAKAEEARSTYYQHTKTTYSKTTSSHSTTLRKIVWIAGTFIAFVFLSITLPIIFSSSETSAEEDAQTGTQFYEMAEYDSARVWYRRALRKDPENVEAVIGYGNAIWYFDDEDSALTMFNKALEIDPENEYARYRRAGMYSQTRRYDQALVELKILLDQNPEYYNTMQLMGDVYYNQNNFDAALPWYEKAYNNGVRNRWICHLMAYLYDRKNEIPRAVGLYKEAISYDSSNVDVYVRLGELLPGSDGVFFRQRAAELNR
ncbi:tetratricopeptide repeat protein [Pseudochryseolinea flava]|uniref:Tetratricopeptide repeat protein n=1 Tax=Pseudochryseolinea flava TaxID=2059302 RepID=A0A364XZW1_9BACT|nr:tetratricopeptide repeat protein [Pseudochryseolinea flava]RAV99870.1 hypothetical protein DQQ10_17675 [Pseudochryseolinea flava]